MNLLLWIVVILVLVGLLPQMPYWGPSSQWGYYPSGGLLLLIIILLLFFR